VALKTVSPHAQSDIGADMQHPDGRKIVFLTPEEEKICDMATD
jgi:hypothetical protein